MSKTGDYIQEFLDDVGYQLGYNNNDLPKLKDIERIWMEKIHMLLLVIDEDYDQIGDIQEHEGLGPWIVNIMMGYNKDGQPVSWLDFLLNQDPDNDKYKFNSFGKKGE